MMYMHVCSFYFLKEKWVIFNSRRWDFLSGKTFFLSRFSGFVFVVVVMDKTKQNKKNQPDNPKKKKITRMEYIIIYFEFTLHSFSLFCLFCF